MERLTKEKQIGPFASLKDEAEAVPGAFGTYDCLYAHMVAVTQLKEYEDTGLEPKEVQIVSEMFAGDPYVPISKVSDLVKAYREGRVEILPPNDPLTLDELREMDGEPVWVTENGYQSRWALVFVFGKVNNIIYITFSNGSQPLAQTLLYDGCKIYRRKPVEGASP